MRNPLGIVKRRFAAAIQWRVDRSVDIRTAALMATVHGLSQQLTASVASTADWRLELERSIARLGDAMNHLRDELRAGENLSADLSSEWKSTLSELRSILDEIDERSQGLQSREQSRS